VHLFVAVDQEGGNVARLKERYGFRRTVSQQYLGSRDDLLVTRLFGLLTAETLAGSGINLNLAPVVDLNTNPDNPVIGRLGRSFSADHVAVTNHSLEVISAHHTQRVLTTLKHFPGHGSSREDSHLGFVDVTYTWSPLELEPYDKIIKAGLCDVVMTAHIFNANLDPDLPATLSEKTIGGLLRGRLNYDGVVMTDDLQMKAISDHYSFEDTIELAIHAGVDILTIGNNLMYGPGTARRAVAIISSLVQSGRIPPERIEQSYQRIMRLKAWLTA
jgi:beta-N-acetylhexosaminidase